MREGVESVAIIMNILEFRYEYEIGGRRLQPLANRGRGRRGDAARLQIGRVEPGLTVDHTFRRNRQGSWKDQATRRHSCQGEVKILFWCVLSIHPGELATSRDGSDSLQVLSFAL